MNYQLIHDRLKSGTDADVKIRIYFPDERQYIYITTKVTVHPKYWTGEKVHHKHPHHILYNSKISDALEKLNRYDIHCQANKRKPNAKEVKNLFKTNTDQAITLLEFFNREQPLQELTASTITHERRSITTFTELFYNMPIPEISLQHIQELEQYLRNQGFALDTRYNYHKHLRKYLYRAKDKNIITSIPYRQFKLKRSDESSRMYLTTIELAAIEVVKPGTESMQRVKDRFLLSCYTGLSFADISRLRQSDIKEAIGARWIIMQRQKTSKSFQVPLIAKAIEILNRYPDDPVFQPITNQVFNHFLKDLAAISGINKPLTSHQARHTFATSVALEHGVSLESLSAMMGTTMKTAQWYGRIINVRILNEMKGLV
jgi:integrase/recombinase XerD